MIIIITIIIVTEPFASFPLSLHYHTPTKYPSPSYRSFKYNKSTKLFHMNLFPNQIFDPSRCSASKPVGRRTRECHRARSPGSQGVVVCAVRFGPIQKQVILILNPAARTIWHLLQKQEMEMNMQENQNDGYTSPH